LTCAPLSANACGYSEARNVFSGPVTGGAVCNDFTTSGAVSPYAHRCHLLDGLTPDDTVRFRWRFASDGGVEFAGFYLDDIAVTNVRLPNACVPDTCSGQSDGTPCADGDACTAGDVCGSGVCSAGAPVTAPAETSDVSVASDKTTYSWSAAANATRYDVVRGAIDALPVGPGGGDEACFDDLPGTSLVDATVPAAGTGYWYLSRGENACAAGSFGQRSSGALRTTATCP
jgi:hypothetical protein